MSEFNKMRKNTFKKGVGFSKYDSNGNVVYSESVGRNGETVQHFYEYDNLGRRNKYSEVSNSGILMVEYTRYDNTGSVYKYIWNEIHHTSTIKIINNMGRVTYSKTINSDTGKYTTTIYDSYKDKNIKETGTDLFVLNFSFMT